MGCYRACVLTRFNGFAEQGVRNLQNVSLLNLSDLIVIRVSLNFVIYEIQRCVVHLFNKLTITQVLLHEMVSSTYN